MINKSFIRSFLYNSLKCLQIIERAVTKKPIEYPQQEKEEQQTVFTEDDFQKFEAEYLDE